MWLMSETLLTSQLDRVSMLVSSSSMMLDADPILSFLSSKLIFFFSSIGDGGMKVTSLCSMGLIVTVIRGCGLCRLKLLIVLKELRLRQVSGIFVSTEFSVDAALLKKG